MGCCNFVVYLDDDLDSDRLIALLRHESWTVISPRSVGTSGWPDEAHLEFCAQHCYPILTRNPRDFRALHEQWRKEGREHAGILAVYEERDISKNMRPHDIVRAIKNLLSSGVPIANEFIVLNFWR